jgi:hypothetical protein
MSTWHVSHGRCLPQRFLDFCPLSHIRLFVCLIGAPPTLLGIVVCNRMRKARLGNVDLEAFEKKENQELHIFA